MKSGKSLLYHIRTSSSIFDFFLRFHSLTCTCRAFDQVHDLITKQARRPWIKRYLKRDEILGLISKSDTRLTEALGMFSVSIYF